jgi:predicted PurR-regulated permease PerM
MMELKNYNVYFFFAILAGISGLVFFLIKPFVIPFVMAVILASLFGPVYRWFLRVTKGSKIISSSLTCLSIALIILIPLMMVSALVVNEAQNTLAYFSKDTAPGKTLVDGIRNALTSLPLINHFAINNLVTEESIVNVAKSISQNAIIIFQGAYQGVAHFMFVVFAMFFSLFYLFMEGDELMKRIMTLTPLKDNYEKMLVEKFNTISKATLRGTSLIAIMQGVMGGILFWTTGVASPVFFGILMMLTSVIPSVGSALIWLPVGMFMIMLGKVNMGITILLIGGLVIGSVDNFIKPKLVGKGTQIHPLLVLFSTLGGISLFGIVGFIVGPIIISLFIALWEIYALEFKQQLQEFNQ